MFERLVWAPEKRPKDILAPCKPSPVVAQADWMNLAGQGSETVRLRSRRTKEFPGRACEQLKSCPAPNRSSKRSSTRELEPQSSLLTFPGARGLINSVGKSLSHDQESYPRSCFPQLWALGVELGGSNSLTSLTLGQVAFYDQASRKAEPSD